jgi:ABC-type glycerol-3-phosphate transport system substrate-binding protein
MSKNSLSRREFLKIGAAAASAAATSGLASASPISVPYFIRQAEPLKLGVGGWAVDSITALLEQLDFTGQTGIAVEVLTRPGAPDEMITQMAAGAQARNSPYDVIDFEDELAITASRAGWMMTLDDLLPTDFWDDFSPGMMAMMDVWSRYNGETFRIHHNFEACYWWYRKDWFDERGVAVPTTWEEVAALGAEFTDDSTGVWATEEGMTSGGFLNVYLAWITLQAGGNQFDAGEEFRTGLQYIYDLMNTHNCLNPASLQKDYDQQNADYLADRVAFMRQWPFFYSVSRGAADWYEEGKAEIALPPVGPGGAANSTYAAGWGWGIPAHTQRPEEAGQLLSFLVDKDNAVAMAEFDVWYLSARNSVLDAVGENEGIPAALKMYSDAGVIGTRPFNEKFVEALSIVEDAASAYLTDQISLDDAIAQASSGMESL